ncbi:MAG: imidazole glycerol phosphate synthase subunit HisH [Oscillospiraceae bacterium]|nr:imidazole glycerol phosphate synthase subunit HisH [Oscillospiraceae bacterium]
MIALIDYGAGNLQSVITALQYIGCEDVCVTKDKDVLLSADAAILPGVGSFGHAMECLHQSGLVEPVKEFIASDKPFLGICLGLQMLFEESEESPGVPGLGVLKGKISLIPYEYGMDMKIPHMGWNSLDIQKPGGLFAGIENGAYVYFVHSYYLHAEDRDVVSSQTKYGVLIDASIQRGNLYATQFHPEKSGDVGIQMLRNFVSLIHK